MSEQFEYFNLMRKQWMPIKGRVYTAALGIAIDVPALRDHPLIVHRDVDTGKRWIVAHLETSAFIADGKTRKEAMKNAEEKILRLGNEAFIEEVDKVKEWIRSQTDDAGDHA